MFGMDMVGARRSWAPGAFSTRFGGDLWDALGRSMRGLSRLGVFADGCVGTGFVRQRAELHVM